MPVAKIVHSEDAPQEAVHYSFAAGEFDLGGRKKSHETDDPSLISEANAHPYLDVQVEQVEGQAGDFREQLDPKDDALSAQNSIANDPDAVKAAQVEVVEVQPVAIDAGLDQTEPVVEGGVAETLAADETSKTGKKKN